jgi:SAM-dependent methyltransferase
MSRVKPVPPDQIDVLVRDVAGALDLGRDDLLLDLCCGNGLITFRLSRLCRTVVGADYSPDLIEIARERHSRPNTVYLHRAADALRPSDLPMGLPTKVCVNSGLQYFTVAMAESLLRSLRLLQDELTIYLTDVPDSGKLGVYYSGQQRWEEFERRRAEGTEAIGSWWDRDHLHSLFTAAGYSCTMLDPASDRSMAHYRFDVLGRFPA